MVKAIVVVWTEESEQHLREVFEYISEDSPKNALKVIEDIIEAVSKTIKNPEVYAADKYILNNDGSYRALEKHHYRITYRIEDHIVRILRIRHTSREPKLY